MLVLKGDLAIFSLELARALQAIRYWFKVIKLKDNRLARAACEELLGMKKRSNPSVLKNCFTEQVFRIYGMIVWVKEMM